MFNKRGEEGGSSVGTIVGIIVIAVAALIVVLFFTGTFEYIGNLFQKAPGDLEAFSTACAGYIDAGAYNSYCRQFNPGTIYGIEGTYNCQFDAIKVSVEQQKGAVDCKTLFGADYETADKSAETECKKLEGNNQLKPGTYINGKKCEVATPNGWGIPIDATK